MLDFFSPAMMTPRFLILWMAQSGPQSDWVLNSGDFSTSSSLACGHVLSLNLFSIQKRRDSQHACFQKSWYLNIFEIEMLCLDNQLTLSNWRVIMCIYIYIYMNTYIYIYIHTYKPIITKYQSLPYLCLFFGPMSVTCQPPQPVSGRHTECGWITSSTSRQCRIAGSGRQCVVDLGDLTKFGEFYPRNSWYC